VTDPGVPDPGVPDPGVPDPASAARAETERYHRALYARLPAAGDPADAWRTRPSPHVLRAVAAVPDLRVAVDLGCGEGRHAVPIALAAPGARVLGVDLLPEALTALRAHAAAAGVADRVAAVRADLAHLRLGPAGADLVLACSALEHVPTIDAFRTALARCAEAVRAPGVVCLLVLADRREVLADGTERPALIETPLTGTDVQRAVAATFAGWSVVEHSAGPQHAREVRGGEPYTLVGTMLRWTLRRPAG
jgi:SAM-dependent methyltransferase